MLLDYLQLHPTSDRKFRLYACASFRRRWPLLKDEQIVLRALSSLEQFADGQMSKEEAYRAACEAGKLEPERGVLESWAGDHLRDIAWQNAWVAAWEAHLHSNAQLVKEDGS